jgi:hypothetical protein
MHQYTDLLDIVPFFLSMRIKVRDPNKERILRLSNFLEARMIGSLSTTFVLK